ncbi:MAG: hypothetical protein ACFBWO_17635 [Paracoccaceae bacterium]
MAAGILVSIAVASVIALQASWAGADRRIVLGAAAIASGMMAAFWALAIETLFPGPDLLSRVPIAMATNFAFAALGGAAFTAAAGSLIHKIARYKEKYPDR